MSSNLIDLLQSSGPIALNELNMRASQPVEELLHTLDQLRRERMIVVSGPQADRPLTELSQQEVEHSSELVIQLSSRALHRSFAS